MECAKRLWRRSIEKDKLRCVTMLCDGNSKSFKAVSDLHVYGKEKQITKEECVNHVSKRMGTALRKLIDTLKAERGSPISGKGKVTKDMVLRIQNCYGKTGKEHSNHVPLLKKRIFAILCMQTQSIIIVPLVLHLGVSGRETLQNATALEVTRLMLHCHQM
eukprot:gene9911-18515_t